MVEAKSLGVQKRSGEVQAAGAHSAAAVALVTGDRVTDGSQMDPYLVRAPRLEVTPDQRCGRRMVVATNDFVSGDRTPAVSSDRHPHRIPHPTSERCVYHPAIRVD